MNKGTRSLSQISDANTMVARHPQNKPTLELWVSPIPLMQTEDRHEDRLSMGLKGASGAYTGTGVLLVQLPIQHLAVRTRSCSGLSCLQSGKESHRVLSATC